MPTPDAAVATAATTAANAAAPAAANAAVPAANTAGSSSAGTSLAKLGTTMKGVVMAHPVVWGAVGGALLGIGAYYAIGKLRSKKEESAEQAEPAAA